MTYRIAIGAALAVALTMPAAAAAQEQRRPAAYEALLRCRAVTESAARLRCFDEAVAALESAAQQRELVMVDRTQIRETRRRLFGLDLPDLPFFGNRDKEDREEARSIEGTITAVSSQAGLWLVSLEGAGTWLQADGSRKGRRPNVGAKVKISKTMLGGYIMEVGDRPGFRVKRVR